MSCEHEHHDHDHSHVPPPQTNESQSLYQYIDHDHVRTLNEQEPNSGQKVFKQWTDRLSTQDFVESDVDEQLMFHVPFTGNVKIHSLLVRSTNDEHAPNVIKLYKNKDDLDFEAVDGLKPLVKLDHPENVGGVIGESAGEEGIVEYALNKALFSNVNSITIFVESNHGEETTRILYIGLRGDFAGARSGAPVVTYEAAANPKDHKIESKELFGHNQLGS
ncbi:hypothetical protein TRVA0_014S02036 [Trichomonascus vanleenenianus]|uniref:PITH domain-containing protein n=1 Tax=Trichomonascus vanleenenianus TaxID=2268995 RepID=UPI003ECA3A8C